MTFLGQGHFKATFHPKLPCRIQRKLCRERFSTHTHTHSQTAPTHPPKIPIQQMSISLANLRRVGLPYLKNWMSTFLASFSAFRSVPLRTRRPSTTFQISASFWTKFDWKPLQNDRFWWKVHLTKMRGGWLQFRRILLLLIRWVL